MRVKLFSILLIIFLSCQSRVVENQRWRVPQESFSGLNFKIAANPVDSIEVYLPVKFENEDSLILWIHFHGASYIGKYAAEHARKPVILANINLGQGSSTYEKPFMGENKLPKMLSQIKTGIKKKLQQSLVFQYTIFSSFSAGYGAVRTFLRSPENLDLIDGIIMLDGMHTDYTDKNADFPDNLNQDKLDMYIPFANKAIAGKGVFIITHSDIFPGAYASNKETTDYLLHKIGLKRLPTAEKIATGMHQTSFAQKGKFFIFGFSGQTARDHVDHFHALPYFINLMIENL